MIKRLCSTLFSSKKNAVTVCTPEDDTVERVDHEAQTSGGNCETVDEESGILSTASEVLAAPPIINRILVFCTPGVYRFLKNRIDFTNATAIVFFPEHEYSPNIIDEFCKDEGFSKDCIVPIDECYFARYMSPFRNGYDQGPGLPPMPVVDKLRIRLYQPNASRIYETLSKAISSITGNICNVDIYTEDIVYSGFFIDTAILVNQILTNVSTLEKYLQVHIVFSSHDFFPDFMVTKHRKALIEEIEYIKTDLPPSVRHIIIGDYETVMPPDLIDSCVILTEKENLDFADVAEQLKGAQLSRHQYGWPYFDECDWSDIGYSGFEPKPETIGIIKSYERVARDTLHLYRSADEHWII